MGQSLSQTGLDAGGNVTTYLASTTQPELQPFDWYLALVLAGSHHHALPEDHLRRLRAINHVVDTNPHRKGRVEALEALAHHGYDDHHSLLRNLSE
ncbi:hypothetical protein [Roseovarius sp. MS2]|uniref:hypothetical protein n=1 Tax=Roseovarius sp. MS2 TaxID=3390728 RepID=UPI003F5CB473